MSPGEENDSRILWDTRIEEVNPHHFLWKRATSATQICPPQTGAPTSSTVTTHSSQIGLWQFSILVIIPWVANLLPLLEEAWTERRESKKSGGEAALQMTSWVLTREKPHQQMMAFVLKLLGRSNERMGTESFSSLLQRHIQKTLGKKRPGN